jgi:four helix bundle protein
MTIASKEAREAKYWLELINHSKIINEDLTLLLNLNEELIKLLTSIVLTSKKRTMGS